MAFMLLSVVMVAAAVVLNQLMASNSKTTDTTAGLLFAQRKLDEAARQVQNGAFTDEIDAAEKIYSHDFNAPTTFKYNLTSSPVTNSSMGNMVRLHIEVWWWTENPDRVREGMGRLSAELERLVYISTGVPVH